MTIPSFDGYTVCGQKPQTWLDALRQQGQAFDLLHRSSLGTQLDWAK